MDTHSRTTIEHAVKGKGPVDVVAEFLSSFRVELQGQLAILLLVGIIANVYKIIGGRFHSFCDNQENSAPTEEETYKEQIQLGKRTSRCHTSKPQPLKDRET